MAVVSEDIVADLRQTIAKLQRQLDERSTELHEALESQSATADVLRVINSSPGDLASVFDAILEKAHKLCGVAHGSLQLYDGEQFRAVAVHGLSQAFADRLRRGYVPGPNMPHRRLLEGGRFAQVADIGEIDDPVARAALELGGIRTTLFIPLRKDGTFLGQIVAARREVRPFAEKEIALLESFAAQAVIAIENARLLTEQREALAQQTATADVLKLISRSTFDLGPVLDALVEAAGRLCNAEQGTIWRKDGDVFTALGSYGRSADVTRFIGDSHPRIDRGTCVGRTVLEGHPVHILDVRQDPEYTWSEAVDRAGFRTMLGVPLLREGIPIGAFSLQRREVRPFTEKQIELVTTFADQAVIAIENVRLVTEIRDALERQTATAEVLQVINSSPGNLAPVFDAMLEKAMRLCEGAFGGFWTFDGDRYVAHALRGVPPAYAQFLAGTTLIPGPGTAPYRFLRGERSVIQNIDLANEEPYRAGDPQRRALVDLGGARTALQVPLCKDNAVLGVMTIYRQEVRPFADKQIALLQNFAAQAVIAMENARLITETREALEQQTATAEVLQVINSSPGNLAPVFDAMLGKALRLCDAAFGKLIIYDGEARFHSVAERTIPEPYSKFLAGKQLLYGPGTGPDRLLKGAELVHTPDLREEEPYRAGEPNRRALVELGGARTSLQVPLRKDNALLGIIDIYRQEVRPFSDKQIALVQNFAAQAVIATENARLITETREALERQTATAEVLEVINSSPGDLAPVFAAMLDRALRLCEAAFGTLWTYDGTQVHAAATRGMPPSFAEFLTRSPHAVGSDNALARLLHGAPIVQIADVAQDKAYSMGDPVRRALVELGGGRTLLAVPLRKDNAMLGAFAIYRQEVRPFSDRQIALLENFAAQAVIAMENARLITETREALERQTATADVLGIINSFPGELAPVFDAILEKAHNLCAVAHGSLQLYRDGKFCAVATQGLPEALERSLRQGYTPGPNHPTRQLLEGKRFAQTVDWGKIDDPIARVIESSGIRTTLYIPLRKDEALLGYFSAARPEVKPFTDKEIALLESFAVQAVIAMDNARLLGELRQRTADLARSVDELTATGDVLKIISRSSVDLETVLDALVETVARLCHADQAQINRRRDGWYHFIAGHGFSNEAKAFFLTHPIAADRGTVTGRVEWGRRAVHIPDVTQDRDYTFTEAAKVTGARTILGIPLLREDALIGIFIITRARVAPFTTKEIELATTFADQALIAIENARLFDELRERQAELRVTFDNMGDGVVMFDAGARLAAWNRNFERILDLPDAFLAGRPSYVDFFRYLAERGEYSADLEAELSRTIEDTRREMRFERTRPDGRVIEVRRNPVPGGGFVLIYSDITERKRAEEAIRGARDAAETALRDLQTAQASLLHAQKMAALGQLTAGIAHEIKNPLNFVNNFAGLSVELLDELRAAAAPAISALDDDRRAEIDETIEMLTGNLAKITEHGRRADGIVKSMLAHSRGTSGDRQLADINALVDESLNLAYHGARAQDQNFNITLERDFDATIAPIELVPQDITRVFLNLFGNGFYAANKRRQKMADAPFRPTLRVTTRERGGAIEIAVRDNGVGIAPEHREKLFQPFFTTKPTGEGTGLGLSISYDIVTQEHSGTIAVDSRVGEYTEFTIRLPRAGTGARKDR